MKKVITIQKPLDKVSQEIKSKFKKLYPTLKLTTRKFRNTMMLEIEISDKKEVTNAGKIRLDLMELTSAYKDFDLDIRINFY